MRLGQLLKHLDYKLMQGTKEAEVENIAIHSQKVEKGSLFVCIRGTVTNGIFYIDQAVSKGAVAVISEEMISVPETVTWVRVNDCRKILAEISAAFYGFPAKKMKIIGITGTSGKTTTAYMIHKVLQEAGYKTGLIGTIEIDTGKRKIPAENTSPESLYLQKYLKEMTESGCRMVVMEVSSQALKLKRTEGIWFDTAVFTNLGIDHIGEKEHKDFEEYCLCKQILFTRCNRGVLNCDDRYWKKVIRKSKCKFQTVGMAQRSEYRIEDICCKMENGKIKNSYQLKRGIKKDKIILEIPGKFNVYNSALAFAVCEYYNISGHLIGNSLQKVKIKGRAESFYSKKQVWILIDYAHNAMSLQNILEMVHSYRPKHVICIFGCGGNRSKERRKSMGEVSGIYADLTIITSDNPRDEEPSDIMEQIEYGVKKTQGKYLKIADRQEAVCYAMDQSVKGDVIVLAGRGHETQQEIKGIRYHLDDREIVLEAIEKE